jgi:hypothetical protein
MYEKLMCYIEDYLLERINVDMYVYFENLEKMILDNHQQLKAERPECVDVIRFDMLTTCSFAEPDSPEYTEEVLRKELTENYMKARSLEK